MVHCIECYYMAIGECDGVEPPEDSCDHGLYCTDEMLEKS
jgi:hypothetical protein